MYLYSVNFVNISSAFSWAVKSAQLKILIYIFQACVVKRKFKKAELLIKQAMFLAK